MAENPGEYLAAESINARWGYAARAGFTALPNALIHAQAQLGLSTNDMVVLMNLLSHWWYRTRMAFPGTATIAKRTGLKIRTVQRSIQKLESLKLIEVHRIAGKGAGYNFAGLIAVAEELAEKHEWRSGKVEQRQRPISLEDTFDIVGFNEV